MNKIIYGVDLSGEVTPIMVRNAIIKCFFNAHKSELDQLRNGHDAISDAEFEKIEQMDVILMIKKYFGDVGGDYDNPTKESILQVLDKLKEFAGNFRDQEVIGQHYQEIMQLVEKL